MCVWGRLSCTASVCVFISTTTGECPVAKCPHHPYHLPLQFTIIRHFISLEQAFWATLTPAAQYIINCVGTMEGSKEGPLHFLLYYICNTKYAYILLKLIMCIGHPKLATFCPFWRPALGIRITVATIIHRVVPRNGARNTRIDYPHSTPTKTLNGKTPDESTDAPT